MFQGLILVKQSYLMSVKEKVRLILVVEDVNPTHVTDERTKSKDFKASDYRNRILIHHRSHVEVCWMNS